MLPNPSTIALATLLLGGVVTLCAAPHVDVSPGQTNLAVEVDADQATPDAKRDSGGVLCEPNLRVCQP